VAWVEANYFSTTSIYVSWASVTNATKYKVYRDGSSTALATVTSTSYQNTGLSSGTTYTYRVTAVNEAGNEGPLSSIAVATTPMPQVTGLTATAVSTTSIRLSWSSVSGATYKVYRGSALIGTVTSTSCSVTDLDSGTDYSYQVTAVSASGIEGPSASASAKTHIAAVKNLAVTAGTPPSTSLKVTWTASTGATKYVVTWVKKGGAATPATQTETALTATITGLTADTEYTITVTPSDADNTTGISETKDGKTSAS
jgi:fibronectin type 3 domain-containing protein